MDSLDATLRLANWDAAESVPEPLRDSASRLMTRLASADRLAAGVFKGNPGDVAKVSSLMDAMRRLESAYVAYRKTASSTSPAGSRATDALVNALSEVRTQSFPPN